MAVQQAQVELVFFRQMLDGGDEGFFQRAIIGPMCKDLEDARVVEFRFALRVFLNRQLFPLHPGVKNFEDVVENFVIPDLACRPPLWQREMRQDKLFELGLAQLDGNDVVFGLFWLFRSFTQV
ncbi:MAG: hypothetical protein HY011_31400 [Acidobacteria bacterium]|nr:hypothetical protein [Acidobacteriota bacterium]